jgi:hypothetical protein
MSFSYWRLNLLPNTAYYFDGMRFPRVFTLLALSGLLWPGPLKPRVYACLWFILSWVIFLFFYAGSYKYGVGVRYSLMSMAPLALLAGRGVERLILFGRRWGSDALFFFAHMIFAGVLLAYLPFVRSVGEEAHQSRDDHSAAERFASFIPEDGVVLTQNTSQFQILGKNSAQMSLFHAGSPYAEEVLKPRFKDRIFLHWNYWCNVANPSGANICQDMLTAYETELVDESHLRGQKCALYRVLGAHRHK